ncbi:MAG: carboxypeptidase regulatory-like domain-containing protein [Acidobacteria bacterium]|nr:carboxypeptidase regulatory-like domain-containing protein [Acidobacteriota bacterium]
MSAIRTGALLFLIALAALAQVATSRLDGIVEDESGAVIPGAKVLVVNSRTQARAETTASAEGRFIFPSLQPGLYTVTVEAPGFRKAVVSALELNAAATVSERIKLEIGQVTESVVVEANAVRVQTTEAQIGRSVTMRDIDTLPQLGRSPIILAVFSPGVQIDPGDTTFSRVNGLRQGSNNSKLDGIDVNDAVVPRLGLSLTANNTDSVGEFRIVTNGGKAEYGRSAGAQVELVTRSGTNQIQGNAFDYLRNTALNASNFFNNASGVPRPKYIQNLFGGSLGGPIIKNKTFIFGNYQGSRVKQEVVRNRTVLTPQAKQGIYRWAGGSYDIVRNDPRGKGIDPEMAKIFKLLPDPNNSDVGDGFNTAGFRFNNPADSSNNQVTIKADHNLSSDHRIFFRYSWFKTYSIDSLNNADATFPGLPQGAQGGIRWGYSFGSDWALTPTIVNEFRIGRQSASVDFWRPGRLKGPAIASNLFYDPHRTAFPQGRNSPVNDVTENITKILRKHTLKAGVSMRFINQYGYNDAGIYPDVTLATSFGNSVPSTVGPAGLSSANRQTFDNLYNDLLGRMNQVTQTFYSDLEKFQAAGMPRVRNHLVGEQGWFFQDDWKVSRNLTLNLGLRWEFFGVPKERDELMGTLDKIGQMNSVSQISDLKVSRKNAWYNREWNNFAPRVGFAWDVRGDGRTAIRGAYGTYYDRLIGATISSVDGGTPGFSQSVPVYPNQAAGSDRRVGDGIPLPQQPGAPVLELPLTRSTTVRLFNPNVRAGYVHQYNLTIQKELFRNTVVEIGYVGTRGVKLFMNRDLNQPRVYENFLGAFKELQAWQANNATPVSAGNTLVKIFGTPASAVSSLGSSTVQQGQVGTAANNLDRTYYTRYAAAGVSNFYLRNYPQYNQATQGNNDGQSYYNSLQFSVRRQVGAVKVNANYTFSKSTDNGSAEGNGYTAPIDSFNLRLNKGRGDADRPHSFNMSLIYVLPIGRDKRIGGGMARWLDSLVGGWEAGALTIWQSGAPFTASSGRATTVGTTTWANYTGDRNLGKVERKGNGVWFFTPEEAARFNFPLAGEVGNSGRNSFRNPRFFGTDLSLVKRFRLFESHMVTFRAEGYNLFNNTNFGGLSTNLLQPASYGKLSSTVGGARVVQLALRYDF